MGGWVQVKTVEEVGGEEEVRSDEGEKESGVCS